MRCSLVALVVLGVLPFYHALVLQLTPSIQRCLSESLPAKALLAGEWDFGAGPAGNTSVEVMSQTGNVSFHKLNLQSGHFAVSAQHAGMHYVCVKSNAPCMATLNLRTALEVDDHSTVAKKEHVEAIEAELDRMKKLAVHVYDEMLYMRQRSDRQHATNASTRGRLLWVEVLMMLVVLMMGTWQINYLHNYFKKQKII